MSPKHSSLAYDDIKEEEAVDLLPELNLIVGRQKWIDSSPLEVAETMISVRGRITVSF